MKRDYLRLLGLSLLFLLLARPALPQGTDLGIIRGTVMDASGAVMPKASVEITDLATNSVRKLTSNGEGNYEAAGLRADAHMKRASASQTVLITAEAAQIETESPTIGSTLDNREIIELPRDSRD